MNLRNKFKKPSGYYGFIKLKDGTELEIVERPDNINRQVLKLKSKLDDLGTEVFSPELCLFDNGEYILPDDALELPYLFEEDMSERSCTNFLKMMESEFRINAVLSNCTLNSFMLSFIINKASQEELSPQTIYNIATTQNIFDYKDFINSLSIRAKIGYFTLNPFRTKDNMAMSMDNIISLIKEVISANLNGDKIFEYKEINLLDNDSELKVLLYKMSDEFFDGKFPFNQIEDEIKKDLYKAVYDTLANSNTLKYIIDCLDANPTAPNYSKIKQWFMTEQLKIQEDAKLKKELVESINGIFP